MRITASGTTVPVTNASVVTIVPHEVTWETEQDSNGTIIKSARLPTDKPLKFNVASKTIATDTATIENNIIDSMPGRTRAEKIKNMQAIEASRMTVCIEDRSEEFGFEEWVKFIREAEARLAPQINKILRDQAKKRFFTIDESISGKLFTSDTGFTFMVISVFMHVKEIRIAEVMYVDSVGEWEPTGHEDVVSFKNFRNTMRPSETNLGSPN